MTNFKQFIITRFNIKLFFGQKELFFGLDKNKLPTQTDEWLEERFRMFEKYCFPSVEGQTNQNFVWLCLFDINTPDAYKEKTRALENRYSNFKACYIEPTYSDDLYLQIDQHLRAHLSANDKYVISTNLDNDDAIHKDLTQRIEETFEEDRCNMLYRFVYGYQYFAQKKYLLRMKYPHNHFLTLVREITDEPIRAITHYYHARAHRIMDYKDVVEKPLWIEIVHESNVNNDFRVNGRIRYKPMMGAKDLKNDFNIDIRTQRGSSFINTFTYLPAMFFGTIGKKLFRKILKKKNKANIG